MLRQTLPALALAVGLASAPALAQTAAPDPALDPKVEALLERLDAENPEIVLQAVEIWWQAQEEYRRQQQLQQVAAAWPALARAEGDPAIGPADADATLVEFFDYRCGFCKRVLDDVMGLAQSDSRLRIVFKEFPVLGEMSMVAARAALASDRQGLYAEYHQALMSAPGALDEDRIMEIAGEVGLDIAQLRLDMESEAVTAILAANRALAERLGIRGTPAFVVKNAVAPGAVSRDRLAEMVAGAREEG